MRRQTSQQRRPPLLRPTGRKPTHSITPRSMSFLLPIHNRHQPADPGQRDPPGFVWGMVTSADQIEGVATAGGRGACIWDQFCRQPGAIADMARDHVHRLDDNPDLTGLQRDDRMVDGPVACGVQPQLTRNHRDLPQVPQDQGGRPNRATVQRFVDHALGMHRRLGRPVAGITTHHRPWVMAGLGHAHGIFVPGLRHRATATQVAHHLPVHHGRAVQSLRADSGSACLGIVRNLPTLQPPTDSPADHAHGRLEDGLLVRWFMDPLLAGAAGQVHDCERSMAGRS